MIPSFQSIMLPLLKILSDGKEHTVEEVENALVNYFGLTEEERNQTFPNRRTKIFYYRMTWAKQYLKAASLVTSERRGRKGYWKITEKGLELLSQNPEAIDIKYLMDNFPELKQQFLKSAVKRAPKVAEISPVTETQSTPEEIIEENIRKINLLTKEELKNIILELSPSAFEKLVVDVLVQMGYGGSYEEASQHLGSTGDEGVDGVIKQDILGLDNIFVQAKRWTNATVGRKELQSFVGALHGKKSKKGVFITTSQFTKDALEYASGLSDIKLILIDGERLVDYMLKFKIGVRIYRKYEILKVDNDYFEDF